MSNGKVLNQEELMIFLNHLPSTITIDYPLTNEQIITLEQDGKQYSVELHIDDSHTFSDSEVWDREKPSIGDYKQCFLASNLITYSNLADFREEYRSYTRLSRDVVFAPDTNLFYNRFISNTDIDPKNILLVDSVHKEINRVLNRKYGPKELNSIKKVVKYQRNLLDEFSSRRMKKSRTAYNLALNEYLRYSDQSFKILKTPDLDDDKERVDEQFVEAVSDYKKNSGAYPVVLTSDQLFIDLCDSYKVPGILLKLPTSIEVKTCSPEQLLTLISNLAAVLGVIQVNKTVIFGEYRGKSKPDDYKIHYLRGEIPLEIERDLEICRGLTKLEIDF